MIEKKWIVKQFDIQKAEELKERLGINNTTLCRLFVARGIDTFDKARAFFRPSLEQTHDPHKLKDMEKATGRISNAIERKEKILLIGDYDVDGTAATAMLFEFLSSVYRPGRISYYIPDRYKEGYGVSKDCLEYAAGTGVSLVITLDCGTSSGEIIEAGGKMGIDFIICDHHMAAKELPNAYAILNPKQPGCPYPFKELCGCGVTFKLIVALCDRLNLTTDYFLRYMDLLALATGADVVPILDENRIFVHHGLVKINDDPCAGIKALKELNPAITNYSLRDVIFGLAPKINAAGRMAHAGLAVELFTEKDPIRAKRIAQKLNDLNNLRREQEAGVTKDALSLLKDHQGAASTNATVVFKSGWHKGVLGIVASRLIETFYKPTIVLTTGDEYITGSARSIAGFNIYNALFGCKEFLVKFGGHFGAAGLSLKPENLTIFRKKFEKIVSDTLEDDLAVPRIMIDMELNLEDITGRFYKNVSRMEPFGHGNPRPVFVVRNVLPEPGTRIVGNAHVRFDFKTTGLRFIRGIGFNLRNKFEDLGAGRPLDFVFTIDENQWNGQRFLQLNILDFRIAN